MPAFFATPVTNAGENAAEACLRMLRCLDDPLCVGTYCRGTEITRGWELTHVAAPR